MKKNSKEFLQFLLNDDVPFAKRVATLKAASQGKRLSKTWKEKTPKLEEMGVFGNVWVRKQYYPKAGDPYEGHKHHHDHITLLASGSLLVYIEDEEPKEFVAPTFITIKAEHNHQLIPLEDETVAYCIFALRDENGDVTDMYNEDNTPYGIAD